MLIKKEKTQGDITLAISDFDKCYINPFLLTDKTATIHNTRLNQILSSISLEFQEDKQIIFGTTKTTLKSSSIQ
jgi:hypothetical protein